MDRKERTGLPLTCVHPKQLAKNTHAQKHAGVGGVKEAGRERQTEKERESDMWRVKMKRLEFHKS